MHYACKKKKKKKKRRLTRDKQNFFTIRQPMLNLWCFGTTVSSLLRQIINEKKKKKTLKQQKREQPLALHYDKLPGSQLGRSDDLSWVWPDFAGFEEILTKKLREV